ncbi:unnamed protein product [Microthlaspi erraticum]|uniref:Uncharacterized protein n=1 Tax=Microthlaspi erraticum TaxID=1685480 RepID=A0A6D2JD40_9BRAS|nr:unnamed protein product [Microthlaspi erraticum]
MLDVSKFGSFIVEFSWDIPEKKKLEEDSSTDPSLNASQRFKLDLPRCCEKSVETKKNLSPDVKVQSSLKQEIQELEKDYKTSLMFVAL